MRVRLVICETPVVTVVRRWLKGEAQDDLLRLCKKKGLLCSRRCMRQVASRTPKQVFIKTAKVWGPRFFYPHLPYLSWFYPLRFEGNISHTTISLAFFPFRVFPIRSHIRVIRWKSTIKNIPPNNSHSLPLI